MALGTRRQRRVATQHGAPVPENLSASFLVQNPNDLARLRRINRSGNHDAWRYYGRIGEVHFGLTSGAREMSRARLKAVRWTGPKSNREVRGVVADLVDALQSRNGGQPNLLSSFYLNRMVTGDGFFFGYPQDPGSDDGYLWFDYLSTDELDTTDGKGMVAANGRADKQITRKLSNFSQAGNGEVDVEKFNLDDVILSRIWTPHPRYSNDADGPLKALNLICEELDLLTMSLKAKITSRLAMAGILYLAHNIQITVPPDSPSGAPAPVGEDALVDYLVRMMTQAIMAPDEPSAVIPIIMRGPAGELDTMIQWITMEREVFATDISQRDELLKRIMAGLDLRPEQIEGFGESNHWSSWSTQDVHIKVDVTPAIEAFSWAVTKDYLWPQLRVLVAEGALSSSRWTEPEIRRHTVWFDLSELTVRPNKNSEYQDLHDRGEVSGASLRDAAGATKEDAPSDDERVRMWGWKHGVARAAFWKTSVEDELPYDELFKPAPLPGPDPEPGSDGPVDGSEDRGAPGNDDSDSPTSQRPDR